MKTVKKKKTSDTSKPHVVDILKKSEKKKQLEEFSRDRDAKAKEKKRMNRIEKEAKREVRLTPLSIITSHHTSSHITNSHHHRLC